MTGALELDDVGVELAGRTLLSQLCLRVEPGELVALIGRNGAGKSTLLKVALGLIKPSRGEARIDGRAIAGMSSRARAARIAWLPQHVALHEELTTLELIVGARFRFDESHASAVVAARRAMARTGVTELHARAVISLSGGERQRVALAALLAQEAPLLLMDEPASHLDPAQQITTYRLIGDLWRSGHGILCVTHDLNLLHHALAGAPLDRVRVLGLDGGAVSFECGFGDAALARALSQTFGVRISTLSCEGINLFVAMSDEAP